MRLPLFSTSALFAILIGALSACATNPRFSAYQQEDFDSSSTFSRRFPGSAATSCEAARRALLSQGYVVSKQKAELVEGQKHFQPDKDNHIEIAFHVVCANEDAEGRSATVFANALQDKYIVEKSANSASLGLSALGSVSLPFGASDDSLAKVGSETIQTDKFYERFFALVEHYLDMAADEGQAESGKEAGSSGAAAAKQ